MSSTFTGTRGAEVVRYCGPGETPGPHRLRFTVTSETKGMTPKEVLDLAFTLIASVTPYWIDAE